MLRDIATNINLFYLRSNLIDKDGLDDPIGARQGYPLMLDHMPRDSPLVSINC